MYDLIYLTTGRMIALKSLEHTVAGPHILMHVAHVWILDCILHSAPHRALP